MKQVFKGSVLSKKQCIKTIRSYYALASNEELTQGLHWYNAANKYARQLASRFNLTVQQIAGILAAFSPQTSWSINQRFAVTFLYTPNKIVKCKVQYLKARKILKLTCETDIYNSLAIGDAAFKTKAFFQNIANPTIPLSCTIDRHAIAAATQSSNNTFPLDNRYGKLTKKQYKFFVDCYTELANELNILPHQLQAIVWIVYRRCRELNEHNTQQQYKPFITTEF